MRKVSFIVLLFLLFLCSKGFSQDKNGLYGKHKPSVGSIILTGIGPAYCFGDIGGSVSQQALLGANDWDVRFTRYLFSLGFKQEFKNHFGYKLVFYTGHFAGSDNGSRMAYRNFSYTNNINELTLQGEYNIWGGNFSETPHTLYIYGGVGVLNSNSNFTGDKSTRPDDKFKNSVTSPVVPIGIGYQYRFTDKLAAGVEFGWHYILSDYVDGYSSVTSKHNDTLSALNITITYKLFERNPEKCNCSNW